MMLPIQITSDNEPGMEIAEVLLDSKSLLTKIMPETSMWRKKIFINQLRFTTWMAHQINYVQSPHMSSFLSQSSYENRNNDFLSPD